MELMIAEKCSVSMKQHTDMYVQIGIAASIFVKKNVVLK